MSKRQCRILLPQPSHFCIHHHRRRHYQAYRRRPAHSRHRTRLSLNTRRPIRPIRRSCPTTIHPNFRPIPPNSIPQANHMTKLIPNNSMEPMNRTLNRNLMMLLIGTSLANVGTTPAGEHLSPNPFFFCLSLFFSFFSFPFSHANHSTTQTKSNFLFHLSFLSISILLTCKHFFSLFLDRK